MLKSRGELTPVEMFKLDDALRYHGLPASSPHTVSPSPGLAYVCLTCNSIGEVRDDSLSDEELAKQRDRFVDIYDFECCPEGVTVTFRSRNKRLVDPTILGIVVSVN